MILKRVQMFEASSNRLARFLEVSALSIALSHSGGRQLKAGILKVEPNGSKKDYGRKGISWKERRKGRWSAVRESYLVIMKEAGEVRSDCGLCSQLTQYSSKCTMFSFWTPNSRLSGPLAIIAKVFGPCTWRTKMTKR